jgi:nucleoside-diphosphate-sugar epimerase
VQLVHEDDVGQAFALALLGDGPAGTYNLAGDGVLTGEELVRELGLVALPVPPGLVRGAADLLLRLPVRPPALEWAEAALHPLVVDASLAKQRLGWRPAYTSRAALRDTLEHL